MTLSATPHIAVSIGKGIHNLFCKNYILASLTFSECPENNMTILDQKVNSGKKDNRPQNGVKQVKVEDTAIPANEYQQTVINYQNRNGFEGTIYLYKMPGPGEGPNFYTKFIQSFEKIKILIL